MFSSRVDFQDFILIWTKPQIQKCQNPPRFVGLGVQNRVHLPNIWLCVHLPQWEMHVELSAGPGHGGVPILGALLQAPCTLFSPFSRAFPTGPGRAGTCSSSAKVHQHLPCAPALPSSPPAPVLPQMLCPALGLPVAI